MLALWSAQYIGSYIRALQGPYKNVTFSYASEDGRVRIFADRLDVGRGLRMISADGIKALAPDGTQILTADRIAVETPFPWTGGILRVDAEGALVNLKRDASGRWNVEALFPEQPEEEPSTLPFTVNANRISVVFQDESSPTYGNWIADIEQIQVDGIGEDWNLKLNAFISDVGRVEAETLFLNGSMRRLEISTPNLQAGKLRRYLDSLPEIRNEAWFREWSISEGTFEGQAVFDFAEETTFVARGKATATGLRLFGRNIATASFEGVATQSAMSGVFQSTAAGLSAKAQGTISWREDIALRLDGTLHANSDRAIDAVLRDRILPADLSFSGLRFNGSLEYRREIVAAGEVTAATVDFGGYQAKDVAASLLTDARELRLRNLSGTFYDSKAEGELILGLTDNPSVKGTFEARGITLDRFPNLPEQYVLGGRINVSALVYGPIDAVQATFNIAGTADLVLEDEFESVIERVDVRSRAKFQDGKFLVSSAEIAGPSGSLYATGVYAVDNGSLDFSFTATSVALGLFPSSPASGTLFANGTLAGAIDNPIANARAELYNAEFAGYEIPFAGASLSIRDNVLYANDVDARFGVGQILGNFEIGLGQDQRLFGEGVLVDASLRDFFPELSIYGLATGTWSAFGTITQPSFATQFSSDALVLDQVKFDSLAAKLQWSAGVFNIESLSARVQDGFVEAKGTYAALGDSKIEFNGENLPATSLQSYFGSTLRLGGTTNFDGHIAFLEGAPQSGVAKIGFSEVSLDDVLIGSGSFDANLIGTNVELNGAIGSLDGFVVAEGASFDWNSNEIGGTVSMLRFSSDPIYRLMQKELVRVLTPEAYEVVSNSTASITAIAQFGGTLEDWRSKIALTVSDIRYRDLSIGIFDAAADREDGRWNISSASLDGGPVRFALNSTSGNFVEEKGELFLDGEFSYIDLSWLPNLWSEVAGIRGTLQVPFRASGRTDSPSILASINGREVAYDQYAVDALAVDRISIDDGEIYADGGRLSIRGLEAKLVEARIPFRYPFEVPDGEPVSVLVDVPSRNLNALSRFFGGLDTNATTGVFEGGSLQLLGTKSDWQMTGSLSAHADSLKFEGVDTTFVVPRAELRLDPGNIVSIEVFASTPNNGELVILGGYDLLSDAFIAGTNISLNQFPISQRLGEGNSFSTVVTASGIDLSGSLFSPKVGSDQAIIKLEQSILRLDGEFPQTEEVFESPIDPMFAIRAIQIDSAVVRSGSMRATVSGNGFLFGSLANPIAEMAFSVIDGVISLPTQRIDLEQGGVANLRYGRDFTGEAKATLDVDLEGTTRATAFNGLNVQRYKIILNISGDMLSPDGLRIDATSDPPDLSRDQIFAILGQQQLFESIGGAIHGNFETQLRDILSLAAPSFLSPFTRSIERYIGLDYIYLDFTQGGSGVVTLGKSLGSGFTLEYRRPIDDSPKYQSIELLQITYRPPLRGSLLSRLSLAFGIDGQGLWRASLGYSSRF